MQIVLVCRYLLQGETQEGEEGDAELQGEDAVKLHDPMMFCLFLGSVPSRGSRVRQG